MKIRKSALAVVVVLLLASIGVVGCGGKPADKAASPAPAGKEEPTPAQGGTSPVQMKLSHPSPESHPSAQAYTFLAKRVEELTKGQVKITVYPGGSLVTDPEVLNAVRQGNIDIAHFAVSYVTPTIKELTPFEVPGAYNGEKYPEWAKATQPIVEKIFAKYGVKYLGSGNRGTTTFVSRKKMIKTPADLKGLKVRASGKWTGDAIKMWGGSAVTIPLGDLPAALERGSVDAAYCGWIVTGPFKLYETAPNVSFTSMQELYAGLIMSQKAWGMLNQEQQAALMKGVEEMMQFSKDIFEKEKQKTIQAIKDAKGTVYTLTDAENAAFKEATKTLMDQVKEFSGPEGAELIKVFESVQ